MAHWTVALARAEGSIFNIISSFLQTGALNVLDGQFSTIDRINAGVPQGSVMGPMFFLVFINDLSDDILLRIGLHADDTTVYSGIDNCSQFKKVKMVAEIGIFEWSWNRWQVTSNGIKTKLMPFTHQINIKITTFEQ